MSQGRVKAVWSSGKPCPQGITDSSSEKSSAVYTTEVITKVLREEGKSFDARSASLGHTLQGGVPSPLDRTRAARFATLSMQFLEAHAEPNSQSHARRGRAGILTETACMIAIRKGTIVYATMEEVMRYTDMEKRRGTDVWWAGIKNLVELMGGRAGVLADIQLRHKVHDITDIWKTKAHIHGA